MTSVITDNVERIGEAGLVEQPKRKNWTPTAGESYVCSWKGPKGKVDEKVEELQDDEKVGQIEIVYGPVCTITATYPAPETWTITQVNDAAEENASWELMPEEVQQDIRKAKKFRNFSAWIAKIDAAIDSHSNDSINQNWDTAYISQAGAGWGASGPILNKYRDLRLAGVETYTILTYTVRQTMVISRNSDKQAVLDDVGTVITAATLKALIPSGNIQLKNLIESVKDENGTAYKWLIMGPSVTRLNNGKWQITQEYRAGHYSPSLYEGGDYEPLEIP